MKSQQPAAKKILVIRYRFIGDTILTVPFLRNLRKAYPDARIDVLVGPQSGEVLEGCPYINELIVFDTTRFHKYDRGAGEKKSFWSYVSSLRQENYDTAFVLKRSWSSALLALLIGARTRVGYATEGRQILLTHSIKHDLHMHEVDSTLTVLECAGIPVVDRYLESWVSTDEQNQIESLAKFAQADKEKKRVLIHAAAAHPDKLYPLESWVEIVKILAAQNFLPVFTGAEQDVELYKKLEELSGIKGLNLTGKLSLRLSMALYSNLDLAICTDSGPAHLAAAAGIPTIALFGPTDPVRWRPYTALASKRTLSAAQPEQNQPGKQSLLCENEAFYIEELPCRPCNYHKTCIDRPCLKDLSAISVVKRALELLQRTLKPKG
jgi:heptosyltransferase-2